MASKDQIEEVNSIYNQAITKKTEKINTHYKQLPEAEGLEQIILH